MGRYDGAAVNYASVLEAVPQPIAVCNSEGEVLYLNAMGRAFLGVDDEEDFPRFALADRETFSQVRIDTSGLLKEYFLADVEVFGGERERVSMSLSPLDGDRYRVSLEAAPRAMVAPVLDELDALVAICDGRRKIRLANAALSKILEGGADVDAEPDLLELFVEEDRSRLRVCASKALAGGSPDEITTRIGDGTGEGDEVRVRIRPLSQRDAAGGQQQQRGFLMVAQPGQASFSELQEKFARAEELMSLGELATGVAHELKNPLTSILNYAQLLMEKYRDQLLERSDRERLQRIIDGVERIDRFVRDLLDLAAAEELALTELDLHATLRASVELNRRALREHSVQVKWQLEADDPIVEGHAGGLKQVFSNLVLNAARAMSEEGGTVAVRTRAQGEMVEIDVEDTGRGMPKPVQDRVFEPFYSESPEGAGLGLALVHRLVDQHDGTIEVDSEPGEGTCFTVRLPT